MLGALVDGCVDVIVVLKVSWAAWQDVDVYVRNTLPSLGPVLRHTGHVTPHGQADQL